ncbi:MAG: site-specific integrase [Vulcanimicrobiota bacterium]
MHALNFDDAFRLAEGRPLAQTYPAPVHYQQPGGPALPRTRTTVGDILRENLEDLLARTRPSSHPTRICHTNKLVRLWGPMNAQDLSWQMVEAWAVRRRRQVSDAAVKLELAVLSRAYNLAIERGLPVTNPTTKAKPRLKLKPRKRVQVLSPEMEERLRKAYLFLFGTEGEELWLNERFAILTGLRIGEQAHVRPEHFQTPGYVQVPEEGKTGERPVPLCQEAREIADRLLKRAREHGHEYVFWPESNAQSRLRAAEAHVRRRFRPACEHIGLKGYQRRDLRRTFASRLIQAGVGIFSVQKLLGHTNTNTTQIYCHLQLANLDQAVAVFDK